MSEKINGFMCYLPVEKIFPHPDNPRKDLGDLKELTASIAAKGVLQNLTVVPRVVDGQEIQDEYTAVIGHRRHAAAQLAGLLKVPCVIADMTPAEQFETMMIENVQRNALTLYEQAQGFQTMLDMGNSVAEVARKTGFSETTIRKRSQLAQLPEDKFKKTIHRGASMEDYLKLSKIEDQERRDKVLETVGTAEFNNSYKKAMEDQKFKAFWQELMAYMEEAAWITKADNSSGYNYIKSYGRSNQELPSPVEDAKPGQYIWVRYTDYIAIYRKAGKQTKSKEEKLKDKLKKDLEEISGQLRSTEKRFREMRLEFVKNFTAFSTYEMDIAAFAARALTHSAAQTSAVKEVADLLGIKTYTPKGEYYERLNPEQFNSVLFNQPQKALLYAAYISLDGATGSRWSYRTSHWEKDICIPKHYQSESLDVLYTCLKSLDYEMSEEEIQLQDGTHPLFDHADKLYKAYLENLKEAKGNKKKDAKAAAKKGKKK